MLERVSSESKIILSDPVLRIHSGPAKLLYLPPFSLGFQLAYNFRRPLKFDKISKKVWKLPKGQ